MINSFNKSLFAKVSHYIFLSKELRDYLQGSPEDWRKLQRVFNWTVDAIYQDIINFEKAHLDDPDAIKKVKGRFQDRYRKYFLYGEFIRWSKEKPLGYAGDYKIIDAIYTNQPTTGGFDRLWDNYFQQLATCKAIRERKEDLKKFISDFVKERKNKPLRIMSLASGPAREIKELLESAQSILSEKVIFDCYDLDINALKYAKELCGNKNINFIQKNALRLAATKNIKRDIPIEYDLIYSAGLFDYLDDKFSVRLISNLFRVLRNNGKMIISNFGDRYNNPSVSWMEWVADWYLVYRKEIEFSKLFLDAGILPISYKVMPQKSGAIQYCFVDKD